MSMAVLSYMLDTKHILLKCMSVRAYEIIEYGQFLTQASDNGSP